MAKKKIYPDVVLEEPCPERKQLTHFISTAHLIPGLNLFLVEGITSKHIGSADWFEYNRSGKFAVGLDALRAIKAEIEQVQKERAESIERETVLG